MSKTQSNYARLKSIDDTKLENTAAENVESAEILEAKESYMKEILKSLKQEPDIGLLRILDYKSKISILETEIKELKNYEALKNKL
ncbi:201_t:CDS:1 [Dentiscutata heterogama]|uniref:201_t:CDS:1 n=1 Tax=Dentiscutata heterogama TaxID=1316150 RepID=A0ACA9L8E0_9GLOM|nr:201_t:CDS:1 [Dentiscutata heterogama]